MDLELVPACLDALAADLEDDHRALGLAVGAIVGEWPPRGGEWDREAMEHVHRLVKDGSDPRWGPMYVVRDGALVASAGFFGPPDEANEVEIGYSVCMSARRQGVARHAIAELVELARRQGARSIRARTAPSNAGSVAALERNQFREVERTDDESGSAAATFRRLL